MDNSRFARTLLRVHVAVDVLAIFGILVSHIVFLVTAEGDDVLAVPLLFFSLGLVGGVFGLDRTYLRTLLSKNPQRKAVVYFVFSRLAILSVLTTGYVVYLYGGGSTGLLHWLLPAVYSVLVGASAIMLRPPFLLFRRILVGMSILAVTVIVFFGSGTMLLGERGVGFFGRIRDNQTRQDIEILERVVYIYALSHDRTLPATLAVAVKAELAPEGIASQELLDRLDRYEFYFDDPKDRDYELCALFSAAHRQVARESRYRQLYDHGTGRQCFRFEYAVYSGT